MLILSILVGLAFCAPAFSALLGFHKSKGSKVDKTVWPYNDANKR